MNFLLRSTHPVAPDLPSIPEKIQMDMPKRATTLEGLIAEDPYPNSSASEDGDKDSGGAGDASGAAAGSTSKCQVPTGNHIDVTEDEGWIMIPYKELPDDLTKASNVLQLRSLDRSFVFPGEQVHILACLTATKQDTEVITPFKVAAVISKNGNSAQNAKQQVEILEDKSISINEQEHVNGIYDGTATQNLEEESGETGSILEKMDPVQDISATESLIRMQEHKQKTETLLERFRKSNFFVRIAESDEPLWSKRNPPDASSINSDMVRQRTQSNDGQSRKSSRGDLLNAVIDSGSFDGYTSGGVARNTARCYSLCNGDIVVLLQVNVANIKIKDPVLEVLQFEKYQASDVSGNISSLHDDPCSELLNWLLPLDRTLPPPRPLSPPLSSVSVLTSASQKSTSSVSSGSQIFSFGHFRSNSMPTLPQISAPSSVLSPTNFKPSFELEDFDRFSPEKLTKSPDMENDGLLSFRGVPLVPERFSVHCGLDGIYLPGRRWRRKLEIIQPVEIHSFAADCITEDLLCIQIKNVSPAHIPDIIIFLDAITVVSEEEYKGGSPLSLPIASIEAGNGHNLPNLALRRNEEHSFILKPATTVGRDHKGYNNTNSLLSHSKIGESASNMHVVSRVTEGRRASPSSDQYAIVASCRCNYTESKLFFKQPISWRPRIARDLMISVVSEMSKETVGPNREVPRLPVQVLTLQASNLTSEDLTLTVIAPISSNSSPSVVSLNSGPTTPMSPFIGYPESMGKGVDKHGISIQRLSSMPAMLENHKEKDVGESRPLSAAERTDLASDVVLSSDLGCTHLWLQSEVPLGCVPAHSSSTVKLELLPLTDGIITLDTLQVAVKEKGQTYTPEQPLKISVTSSIPTGIA